MTPTECINRIEEECHVFFWAESQDTFPKIARGVLEDGTLFVLTCNETTAELIAGDYNPQTIDLPYDDFYSNTPCKNSCMEDYIDIFKALIYTLDKKET